MAFKKSPVSDTSSTQRIKLIRYLNARDGGTSGKDERLHNMFLEALNDKVSGDDRRFLVKRGGVEEVIASVAVGTVRGMFFWHDLGKLFYCVGNDIYMYNTNNGTQVTITNPFGTTSGDVGFALFFYDNGSAKLVATDGTTLITIDASNTVVTCVDSDLPTHLPYPVFLDGYIFVAKEGTGDIYNSDLNDPMSWDASGYISAEMEGDDITFLAKVNNYLVVFGSSSIEYFWDAGDAAPGSPLQRNDTPIKYVTFIGGAAQYGNAFYFIGVKQNGQADIMMLKDFRVDDLGSTTVRRYLNGLNTDLADWRGGIVSCKGHTFYIVNADTDITWVLDLDTKEWATWSYQDTAYFPLEISDHAVNDTVAVNYFALAGDSIIYRLTDDVHRDDGTNFTCIVQTEADNFGTLNRKTMRRLVVIGDRPATSVDLNVSWSDDDYQTYNTARAINLNQDLPSTYNLGWFRQRNFKLTFTANENLRLQELEVEINKGR